MIVSYNELLELRDMGVIEGSAEGSVNASSIDVRLGNFIQIERAPAFKGQVKARILADRQPLDFQEVALREQPQGWILEPGEFILAHTLETFNLPMDISAEFRLKSSVARMGISHALAVWCDPGWHGSSLTLELYNISRYHAIIIGAGDKIGQMIFHRHEPVPHEKSYRVKGAYNNDPGAQPTKPERPGPETKTINI